MFLRSSLRLCSTGPAMQWPRNFSEKGSPQSVRAIGSHGAGVRERRAARPNLACDRSNSTSISNSASEKQESEHSLLSGVQILKKLPWSPWRLAESEQLAQAAPPATYATGAAPAAKPATAHGARGSHRPLSPEQGRQAHPQRKGFSPPQGGSGGSSGGSSEELINQRAPRARKGVEHHPSATAHRPPPVVDRGARNHLPLAAYVILRRVVRMSLQILQRRSVFSFTLIGDGMPG